MELSHTSAMLTGSTNPKRSGMNSHRAYAATIIREEAKTLSELATRLDDSFDSIVDSIINRPTHGRVVLCGTGKAGYVAMKFSATLASVGIPSFFLHPSEASHGDLGRVQHGDIVFILSNSGETEEIVRLLHPLNEAGALIFAVTANSDSTLARMADKTICLGNIREAGTPHLAPTSSAIAMIAIGDAIAMTVAHARSLSIAEFRRYHPGGSLGRSLIPISEVMRTGEFMCLVTEELPTKEVIQRYTATPGRPGAATIVDANGRVSGIFTDGNLRRLLTESDNFDFLLKPIKTVMTRSPRCILNHLLARDALELLSSFKIDQVVVIDDDNKPNGIIDIQDIAQIFRGVE